MLLQLWQWHGSNLQEQHSKLLYLMSSWLLCKLCELYTLHKEKVYIIYALKSKRLPSNQSLRKTTSLSFHTSSSYTTRPFAWCSILRRLSTSLSCLRIWWRNWIRVCTCPTVVAPRACSSAPSFPPKFLSFFSGRSSMSAAIPLQDPIIRSDDLCSCHEILPLLNGRLTARRPSSV